MVWRCLFSELRLIFLKNVPGATSIPKQFTTFLHGDWKIYIYFIVILRQNFDIQLPPSDHCDRGGQSPFKKMLMTHLHRIRNELKNELNRCLDLDQHIFPIDDAIQLTLLGCFIQFFFFQYFFLWITLLIHAFTYWLSVLFCRP